MSLRINLNSAAMNAHRNLAATDNAAGKSIERLSSGYKINRGSDDPAGLVISENLRAQIGGLGQAISNSQDAVNLVKTAEGALTEVHSLLRSMRDLAVHAANTGANDSGAITADQSQIQSAIESLDRIASNTAFGNRKLLDGSGSLTAKVLDTANVNSVKLASSGSAFESLTGYASVTVTTAATKATVSGTVDTDNGTAGVQAYGSAAANLDAASTITINGVEIGNFTTSNTVQNVIDAVNLKSDTTGVKADFNAGQIRLTQQGYGSENVVALSDSGGAILEGGGSAVAKGIDAAATITVGTTTSTFNTGKGNVLQNANGDVVKMVGAGTNSTNAFYVDGEALTFQIGAMAGETASIAIDSTKSDNLGTSVSGLAFDNVSEIDVTTNAQDAIKVLDAAIAQVSTQRADLGAFMKNVLESNINSLGVTKENVAASESSIRDADMAAEMVQFTRFQILQQAGTSMLTQANQAPQQLLSLLR